jgi:copper chaperone NosL
MQPRHVIFALFVSLLVATASCTRRDDRCAFCGMRIDGSSPWRADLVLTDGALKHFDTPRCALFTWRSGRIDAKSLRVIDYYEHQWANGEDVFFVVGSDVIGPMGPDLVPVDRNHAQKFAQDHGAPRPLALDAITPQLLSELR